MDFEAGSGDWSRNSETTATAKMAEVVTDKPDKSFNRHLSNSTLRVKNASHEASGSSFNPGPHENALTPDLTPYSFPLPCHILRAYAAQDHYLYYYLYFQNVHLLRGLESLIRNAGEGLVEGVIFHYVCRGRNPIG